jgi:hypothetical protein
VSRSIRHEHIAVNDADAGANLNSRATLEESPEMVMMTTEYSCSPESIAT